MEPRDAVGGARVGELRMLVEDGDDRLLAAGEMRRAQLAYSVVRRIRTALAALRQRGPHEGVDFRVTALPRDHARSRCVAIRPDAALGIGSVVEQQAHERGVAAQHGHVQRAHLATAEIDDLGTAL